MLVKKPSNKFIELLKALEFELLTENMSIKLGNVKKSEVDDHIELVLSGLLFSRKFFHFQNNIIYLKYVYLEKNL